MQAPGSRDAITPAQKQPSRHVTVRLTPGQRSTEARQEESRHHLGEHLHGCWRKDSTLPCVMSQEDGGIGLPETTGREAEHEGNDVVLARMNAPSVQTEKR